MMEVYLINHLRVPVTVNEEIIESKLSDFKRTSSFYQQIRKEKPILLEPPMHSKNKN
jgi:ribosomal protein S19